MDDEEKPVVKEGTFLNFMGKNSIVLIKESLFFSLKYISSNKKPNLGRTDHPELYANINRQFDVLTEFINGPCECNQVIMMENFTQGDLELLLGFVKRQINNLESPFLDLQCKAVVL